MHIPDGYLSPATCAVMYAASTPFWYVAGRRVRQALTSRTVPLLSLLSAFVFTIQMFNVPLPGGTTGHAVGATLIAIILGPWAAIIGVTVVLAIQALFFGDGGILALGANVFNMGIVGSLVGYGVYRLLALRTDLASARQVVAAAVAGYTAVQASALFTAVELGLQPLLFRAPDGTPLYSPYSLEVAIPAMMGGHLLVAGVVEALITGGVIAYLRRAQPDLLQTTPQVRRSLLPLWIALGILILLTPIGLLASGTAWGEWVAEELENLGLGFVPQGIQQFYGLWQAPASGYGIPGLDERAGYVLAAIIGVVLIVGTMLALGWWFNRRRPEVPPEAPPQGGHPHPHSFIEKTIGHVSEALQSSLFHEETARSPGLLQGLDPRVKVATFVGFVLAVALIQKVVLLLALYLVALALALASRIPMGFFVKRVWLFMPFFTGVVALPALFNLVTPGPSLLTLLTFDTPPRLGPFILPQEIAITEPGLRTASFLILRVANSVSFALLLVLTTRWNHLLRALRVLRVPQSFIVILGMTYRYIFLLLQTGQAMFLARESRTVGRISAAENRRFLMAAVSTLLAKSYQMSSDVYLAMVSRGYRGEVAILDTFRWRAVDWAWLAACLAFYLALWQAGHWLL